MEMEKDNANPTILNTSQLPTRQRKKGRKVQKGAKSKISDIMRKPQYLSGPFYNIEWSDDTVSDDDDFAAEPIDEQEVYGKTAQPFYAIHPLYVSDESRGLWISDGQCGVGKVTALTTHPCSRLILQPPRLDVIHTSP